MVGALRKSIFSTPPSLSRKFTQHFLIITRTYPAWHAEIAQRRREVERLAAAQRESLVHKKLLALKNA
jgi:hypothetical protein